MVMIADLLSWPSRNLPTKIEPWSMDSKTCALTISTCHVLSLYNGIKQSSKHFGRCTISLHRVPQLARLGCLIASTGLGLSTLERTILFEPFY